MVQWLVSGPMIMRSKCAHNIAGVRPRGPTFPRVTGSIGKPGALISRCVDMRRGRFYCLCNDFFIRILKDEIKCWFRLFHRPFRCLLKSCSLAAHAARTNNPARKSQYFIVTHLLLRPSGFWYFSDHGLNQTAMRVRTDWLRSASHIINDDNDINEIHIA